METDVKGQLGGMECSEERRKSMAEESGRWRCGVCGMSNAEIMADAEDRCRGAPQSQPVIVPDELKMGFRDEIEKSKERQKAKEEEAETAAIAEGFVKTGPSDHSPSEAIQAASSHQPTPIQETSPSIPTQSIQTQTMPLPERPIEQIEGWRNDNGVPVWLDRLIVALIVFLVALLIRIMYVGV
jgi:ubiquitin-conjugating enzyme E2 J1